MADEFVKGFGILTIAGLGWMTISGWYNTASFESESQLVDAAPAALDVYGQLALTVREALFWFAILGALAFWVVVPAIRQYRGTGEE